MEINIILQINQWWYVLQIILLIKKIVRILYDSSQILNLMQIQFLKDKYLHSKTYISKVMHELYPTQLTCIVVIVLCLICNWPTRIILGNIGIDEFWQKSDDQNRLNPDSYSRIRNTGSTGNFCVYFAVYSRTQCPF
jgi:hypothetical protein